jgi:hypothetical protein
VAIALAIASSSIGRHTVHVNIIWRRAQAWMFDLFDLAGGMRNAYEHGVDLETQRLIRLTKCERAIRRLYSAGASLPHDERRPFRDPIEDVLSKSLCRQEWWVTLTYLGQRSGSRTSNRRGSSPSQLTLGGVALHEFSREMVGILPFYLTHFIRWGRPKPKQTSGLYPTQIQSPAFRAAGVIAAVLLGPMLRHVLTYRS